MWPLKKVMVEKPKIAYILALVFYAIGFIGNRFIPNVFCIWTVCQYIFFFFIGMRIRVKEENKEKLFTEIVPWFGWIIIDLAVFVGSIFVNQNSGIVWRMISIGVDFILHVIGAIMAWSILQMLANKVNWQKSKAFNMLSSYSMPMYLFHQQIIYFAIVWLNGKVNPWINAGANFAIALAGSFVISWVLMRWKTTRVLIGEK